MQADSNFTLFPGQRQSPIDLNRPFTPAELALLRHWIALLENLLTKAKERLAKEEK